MTRIVVKQEVADLLRRHGQEVMLCDSTGEALGYFIPAGYSGLDCPYPKEELAEAAKQETGRTLDEILDGLRARS